MDNRKSLTNRREFLNLALATSAVVASKASLAESESMTGRYPDPRVKQLDPRFGSLVIGNTPIEKISTGNLWAEGPAWHGAGRFLVWSDIPADTQRRWLEDDGHVSTFRHPSGKSNGNTFDFQGRQVSCQHYHRRVVRYEYDGSESVLANAFEGKPLNGPNDIVVHPADDSIWFTDPGYGLNWYEGQPGDAELKEAVYRIDGQTGRVDLVTDEVYKPNGLCFSPDYSKLYVSDTGTSHYQEAPREIRMWDIKDNRVLVNGRTFAATTMKGHSGGAVDGIRADVAGNIWAGAGWVGEGYDGVHVFSPGGDRIGVIELPEICSNVCFGGRNRNRLFMTASQSIYAMYVGTRGAHIA